MYRKLCWVFVSAVYAVDDTCTDASCGLGLLQASATKKTQPHRHHFNASLVRGGQLPDPHIGGGGPNEPQPGAPINLQFHTVLQNNLGGSGPDSGEEAILYGDVATGYGGESMNLRVTATSAYTSIDTEKNGLLGTSGTINLLNDNTVDLTFVFESASTGAPIDDMPAFFFTLMDLDQGRFNEAIESIAVSGFSDAFTPASTTLRRSQSGDRTVFTSSRWGSNQNNPMDPMLLTEEAAQVAVALTFPAGTNSFSLTYSVTASTQPEKEPQGRNFLFAGQTALLDCEIQPVDLNFEWAEVLYSNLGGLGPDFDQPEGMRYRNIANIHDRNADLLITTEGVYQPFRQERNGIAGSFGQLNLYRSSSTTFRFQLLDPDTDAPIVVDGLYFSVYDLDQGRRSRLRESFSTGNFATYYTTATTEVEIRDEGNGQTSFWSTTPGNGRDNPSDPLNMTPRQKNRAVTFLYTNTHEFSATFSIGGGPRSGRNIQFAGMSSNVYC